MEIKKGTVVALDYTLKNKEGSILDQSQDGAPLVYLQGYRNIIPGLENALEGKVTGDAMDVVIPAAEAYGEVNPSMEQVVSREAFQGVANLQVGMQFQTQSPQGPVQVRITKIEDDDITVDGNHPLAGQDLYFSVKVQELRAATEEELAHGHIHQSGGCCGGSDKEHSCGCD